MRSADPADNVVPVDGPLKTPTWTKWLPEAFGIRAAVEASKYRWCAREAALWGIATGTAMTLHRFRMQSPIPRAVNFGFATCFLVMNGSYYFCVKRRDYHEQIIELMMQYNAIEPASSMPEQIPVDANHPFVEPAVQPDAPDAVPADKLYVAKLPERKEWQTQLPTQDAEDVFEPYEKR